MDWSDLLSKMLQDHSGEVLILLLTCVCVLTLLAVLPFFLRHNLRKADMIHHEHMQAMEKGQALPVDDGRSRFAGRTALFVPMVAMLSASAVTCFLVSTRTDNVFAVSLAVWVVAGVVSLTAITAGITLIGKLAQIDAGQDEPDEDTVAEDQFTG